MAALSVFEYCYRDASNYKSWGTLLVRGAVSEEAAENIVSVLESREFFIAEQIGIPTKYRELWEFSGGPTNDDHVWHQFHKFRSPTKEELSVPIWGTVDELVSRFSAVQFWNEELSPHWNI